MSQRAERFGGEVGAGSSNKDEKVSLYLRDGPDAFIKSYKPG